MRDGSSGLTTLRSFSMICASFIVLILLSVVRAVDAAGLAAGGAVVSGFGAVLVSALGATAGGAEGPGGRGGGGALRSATICRDLSAA